ncbi:hypothetical protein CcaCcLH18_05736 [Colletotrichum camelliae]|nr:hypothetical protein CcaCcLH18_05736 [Colletotrichum camelliae]
MNTMSRHTACKTSNKVCRERKVRCDGEPECDNCRRSGETCVYLPTNKSSKADLSQSLEAFQQRLERAEVYIAIQTQATRRNLAQNYFDPQQIPGIAMENPEFYFPLPPHVTNGEPCVPHGAGGRPHNPQDNHGDSNGELFHQLQPAGPGSRTDTYPFQIDDLMTARSETPRPGPARPQTSSAPLHRGQVQMPTPREIGSTRGLPDPVGEASVASPIVIPSPASTPLLVPRADVLEDSSRIMGELASFSSTVFTTQAQIASMAGAAANLLSWLRQAPQVTSPGAFKASHGAQMVRETLATLEARVREVQQMAERRHEEAWARLRGAMEEMDPAGTELKAHEGELQSRLDLISQFFKNDYNIWTALGEQETRF